MPPLAVVDSRILDIRQFDMSSVFLTDTKLFNSLSLKENTFETHKELFINSSSKFNRSIRFKRYKLSRR